MFSQKSILSADISKQIADKSLLIAEKEAQVSHIKFEQELNSLHKSTFEKEKSIGDK